MTSEHDWLLKNARELEKHRGKWIAIVGNRIVSSGEVLHDVRKKAKEISKKEPLVFKVPRKDEEAYIL